MATFTHLHVHSAFSPGWGVHHPDALCRAARAMGMERMALTDRNGLYGIPHFIEQARETGMEPIIGAEAVAGGQRAVILARDADGYSNLCRLLSDLHCRKDFNLARALERYRAGIIIISDDIKTISYLCKYSSDGLFVEMSPGHRMHRALALARRFRLPPVATSRAVMLNGKDHGIHRIIRAIALNTSLSRLPADEHACKMDVFLPPHRMADLYPHCPEALENADAIAGKCRTDWDFPGMIFSPLRDMGGDEAIRELEKRARQGALRRYGAITEAMEKRLEKELFLIREKGFAHYFLVVEELAGRCPRTCGRGSAAASLVAYCLGITHVDPIKHNLFFERFLNAGRVDPPDIDIDFPWDERDDVLDFAFSLYGTRRAAMVANQVGFRARGAVREIAKVYGIPAAEIREFTGEAVSRNWEKILQSARLLAGKMRHLSLHCGGLVIVPDEIRKYVPVEVSARGLQVIQWEKDQAEAAGLVKIDILGNRSLAVIRDALRAIRENTGRFIDYAGWRPLDDPATCDLIRSGRTMGCFYIESPATRQLLRKMWGSDPPSCTLRCDLFEHLVMASSIIRPAANAFIREFVARMRGKRWKSLHPLLDEVLNETYGIAIYQEQITQMAMALAGFSAYEGDQLRKIITKKEHHRKLEDYKKQFEAGAVKRNISREVTSLCWEQIISFSGYSFCKPHSASYALVSCKSAYLKAHYPAEFMAAVISNQGGFYSPLAYLSEARRMGLTILPPDVNASDYHYTGKGGEIRVGLMQIQGLSRKGADSLLEERMKDGPFTGFAGFLGGVSMDPSDARLLVKAGCFDDIEGIARRPALIWELLRRHHRPDSGTPMPLFDIPSSDLPAPGAYDAKTVLHHEIETLGMLISRHPLDLHRDAMERVRAVPAAELDSWAGRHVTMIGWWVTGKPVRTKNGKPMEFVTFEDTTAIFDATFFPNAYARFRRKLTRHRPYILKGKVEEEYGVATLNVGWVGFLDDPPAGFQT